MSDLDIYWPKSVAHLKEPYDNGASDHVVIAEISETPQDGYKGFRKLSTALIPLDLVDDVLKSPGGIGWEVQSWGPGPCVGEGQVYETNFWIAGRHKRDERFQTIINSWSRHNREVLLPDNVLLMAYGLVPRYLSDGMVCWDDPHGPVYDVLRVKSHIDYGNEKDAPFGFISIRRDYLEDFCHLKRCAAVATYYEERFSSDDETFVPMLNGEEAVEFELPGRLLDMRLIKGKYHADAPQMSKVWGARLILIPKGRPISDDKNPELIWPGDTEPMNQHRAWENSAQAYVSDMVLQEYESHTEFEIHPESGGVSYDGWWGTDRTNRIGRNHIQIELKKLYEGCPPHVIAHWHRFAVLQSVARHDQEQHGNHNIALRAKSVIQAYLDLTVSLVELSNRLGTGLTQEEIGSLDSKDVAYRGWWSIEVARSLYTIVPLGATQEQFLNRTVTLVKLLELLKPAALRTVAIKLGVPKDQIKDFQSLKLLACISQLANIAKLQGHSLSQDADAVIPSWSPTEAMPELNSLFALNGLRLCQAHTPSKARDNDIARNVGVFRIDVASTASGWGYAIDALYDRLSSDLLAISKLIEETE